ncbi:5'-nucleotidase domain-containing protein 3 [Ixodes scapularis]
MLLGVQHCDITSQNAFEAQKALPTPEVNPFGVFANNELDISQIEVYGFDYDYTLAVYTEALHYLIYDLGRDWLINKFKYPKEIAQLEYRPGFAIRGLQYDMKKGVLMKMDLFHQIQFCSVYRGLTPLTSEETIKIYGGSYIPQYMIRGSSESASFGPSIKLHLDAMRHSHRRLRKGRARPITVM